MKEIIASTKEFFIKNKKELVLAIGVISAGGIGYEIGILRGMGQSSSSVSIEIVEPIRGIEKNKEEGEIENKNPAIQGVTSEQRPKNQTCAFVGSKNSTLYHLPTCAAARRIKEENKRCFVSADDAQKKGYRPGCLK